MSEYDCAPSQPNCAACSNPTGTVCKTCKLGYYLAADSAKCSLCADAMPACVVCLSEHTCTQPCPEGCSACSSSGTCVACGDGLRLDAGKCVPCVEKQLCWCGLVYSPLCRTCNPANGLCSYCVNGYSLKNGACHKIGVAVSLAGGITMIVVFVLVAALVFGICISAGCKKGRRERSFIGTAYQPQNSSIQFW